MQINAIAHGGLFCALHWLDGSKFFLVRALLMVLYTETITTLAYLRVTVFSHALLNNCKIKLHLEGITHVAMTPQRSCWILMGSPVFPASDLHCGCTQTLTNPPENQIDFKAFSLFFFIDLDV